MILGIQLVLFPQDLLREPKLLVDDFAKGFDLFKDGSVIVNNLPEIVPSDLPVCSVSTQDKIFHLSIARGRVDFYSMKASEEENIVPAFYENAKKVVSFICEQRKINRIGVITTTLSEHEDYRVNMEQYFTKKAGAKGANEISFRINQIGEYKNIKTNNISSVNTVTDTQIGDNIVSGIVCTYDKNTVYEERRTLSVEFLKGFIDACRKERIKRY